KPLPRSPGRWTGSSGTLPLGLHPPPQFLQDALDGPLADPQPLADVLAREALGLQLQDGPALRRHQLAEPDEDLVGLGQVAGRVDRVGHVPGTAVVQPEGLLAMHVLLAAGRPAVFIDDLLLRNLCQESDKMTRPFEFRRRGAHLPEEALPDTLQE